MLRAALHMIIPFGGIVDTLVTARGHNKHSERILDLLDNLVSDVRRLEIGTEAKGFVESEEFSDLLHTCIDTAARTQSDSKRKHVAAFLAGTIRQRRVDDLSRQIAWDLRTLQDFHLQILISLGKSLVPNVMARGEGRDGSKVIDLHKLQEIAQVEPIAFQKGISDIERLGFIWFTSEGTAWEGGDITTCRITGYFRRFRDTLLDSLSKDESRESASQ